MLVLTTSTAKACIGIIGVKPQLNRPDFHGISRLH